MFGCIKSKQVSHIPHTVVLSALQVTKDNRADWWLRNLAEDFATYQLPIRYTFLFQVVSWDWQVLWALELDVLAVVNLVLLLQRKFIKLNWSNVLSSKIGTFQVISRTSPSAGPLSHCGQTEATHHIQTGCSCMLKEKLNKQQSNMVLLT